LAHLHPNHHPSSTFPLLDHQLVAFLEATLALPILATNSHTRATSSHTGTIRDHKDRKAHRVVMEVALRMITIKEGHREDLEDTEHLLPSSNKAKAAGFQILRHNSARGSSSSRKATDSRPLHNPLGLRWAWDLCSLPESLVWLVSLSLITNGMSITSTNAEKDTNKVEENKIGSVWFGLVSLMTF